MSIRYSVFFEKFAERYYIKRFKKKYSAHVWDIVQESLEVILRNPKVSIEKGVIETIVDKDTVLVVKVSSIRIPGKKESGRKSGYRCIALLEKENEVSRVLLFYHKNDLPGHGQETARWKKVIRQNYEAYKNFL